MRRSIALLCGGLLALQATACSAGQPTAPHSTTPAARPSTAPRAFAALPDGPNSPDTAWFFHRIRAASGSNSHPATADELMVIFERSHEDAVAVWAPARELVCAANFEGPTFSSKCYARQGSQRSKTIGPFLLDGQGGLKALRAVVALPGTTTRFTAVGDDAHLVSNLRQVQARYPDGTTMSFLFYIIDLGTGDTRGTQPELCDTGRMTCIPAADRFLQA